MQKWLLLSVDRVGPCQPASRCGRFIRSTPLRSASTRRLQHAEGTTTRIGGPWEHRSLDPANDPVPMKLTLRTFSATGLLASSRSYASFRRSGSTWRLTLHWMPSGEFGTNSPTRF